MSGFEDNLPDLARNPVNDADYIAAQTTKHLEKLDRRISRSIGELEGYQDLVQAELAKRAGAAGQLER